MGWVTMARGAGIIAVSMALWTSCVNPEPSPAVPIDENMVATWCRQQVEEARVQAHRAGRLAGQRWLEQRRDRVDEYVRSMEASIEVFRRQVAPVDGGQVTDIRLAREAFEQAKTALNRLPAEMFYLALWWVDSLDLGVSYLDALARALDAVLAGEPADDPTRFMVRYQDLVELYDAWAELTWSQLEELNAGSFRLLTEAAEPELWHHARVQFLTSWPPLLVQSCLAHLRLAGPGADPSDAARTGQPSTRVVSGSVAAESMGPVRLALQDVMVGSARVDGLLKDHAWPEPFRQANADLLAARERCREASVTVSTSPVDQGRAVEVARILVELSSVQAALVGVDRLGSRD